MNAVMRLALALLAVFAMLSGASAGTGCPCEKRQACNDCCSVTGPGAIAPCLWSLAGGVRGADACSLLLSDGQTYGPHCRKGVCGSGAFPHEAEETWSPEAVK